MVKKGSHSKGGKPGNGGTTKKNALLEKDCDSFIIFTNSENEPKQRKNNTTVPATASSTQDPSTLLGDVPKKPDVKKLIGGASWTGKLPMNLLSEHCQKQKWEKPEYTMSKTPEGYHSMVILKARHPKTKELVTLPPFKLPPTHKHLAVKPSALEARHFAATYGLFRVCSMRNVHTMMPPDYRNLWKGEFEILKQEDIKEGRSWLYEADPFAALRERNETKAIADKRRADQENKTQISLNSDTASRAEPTLRVDGSSLKSDVIRSWYDVPKIEMGKKTRANIEDLVRKYAKWNPHKVELSSAEQNSIINEFQTIGFRKSHIQEAVLECKDREEALEWLLIHVPEDDLPGWALPERYVAGVSIASSDMKRESAIKRLTEAGYATNLCQKVFDEMGEEGRALEVLQQILLSKRQNPSDEEILSTDESILSSETIWEEEMSSIHAVFGERFIRLGKEVCQIFLEPVNCIPGMKPVIQLRRSKEYPKKIPLIAIHAALPAYIRLSIIKHALIHSSENFLGEPMLFFLIDWVEENFSRIAESPGKLREISSVTSATSEVLPMNFQKQHSVKYPKALEKVPNQKSIDDWLRRQASPKLHARLQQRKTLPAWKVRESIIDTISMHQVTIISGETGSGKSTQCVQFLLDSMYLEGLGESTKIICTQPRRISAIGLADRVSDERCSTVGQEVGYTIRGESKVSKITKITFVTTGVLLRRLQISGGSINDVMASIADISHIIIDEVHERSLDTDLLLIVLKEVMMKRKDLKVILMSATLDAAIFEDYFSILGKVGRVQISGRTYPVEDYYLDDILRMTDFSYGNDRGKQIDDQANDKEAMESSMIRTISKRINYDLIIKLVKEIDRRLSNSKRDHGILIFMPGVFEIDKVLANLCMMPNFHALPLHASLQSSDQRRVFSSAPIGKRKVIVATNVAETSITIDDIVAVIDSGRVKETSYDAQNKTRKLEETWASRAACKQRRGRAGRVQEGKYYMLFTRDIEDKMMERSEPEIRRVPLEQLCLSVRAMGIKEVGIFLANALTPPDSLAIDNAMVLLSRMGALDGDELTALGSHLSMIPADLRCGKLMVYGAMFGCLDACVTIAAILSTRSPFFSPMDKKEESTASRARFAKDHGDVIGDLRAYEEWVKISNDLGQEKVKKWCFENFLSYQNLNDISSNKTQFLASLRELSFIPSPDSKGTLAYLNKNNSNTGLIRSLCAGAFNPQIARIKFPKKKFASSFTGAVELDPEAKTIKYFNEENSRLFVHPSSTIFKAQSFPGNSVYLAYFNKLATSKVFIRDLTPFNAYTALLLSGPITLDTLGRGIIVDKWLFMKGWARIGVLISRLRCMLDGILAKKIDKPEMDLTGNEVIDAVLKLIEFDGLDQ